MRGEGLKGWRGLKGLKGWRGLGRSKLRSHEAAAGRELFWSEKLLHNYSLVIFLKPRLSNV